MATPTATRFRPERPISLNEQNTDSKGKVVALHNIERLRSAGWLCCYSETIRPLHLSFDNPDEYSEFKQSCKKLNIGLITPVIASPTADFVDIKIVPEEPTSSYEDPLGKMHIG